MTLQIAHIHAVQNVTVSSSMLWNGNSVTLKVRHLVHGFGQDGEWYEVQVESEIGFFFDKKDDALALISNLPHEPDYRDWPKVEGDTL